MGLQQGTGNNGNFSSGRRNTIYNPQNIRSRVSLYFTRLGEERTLLDRKRPVDYFNTCRTTIKRTLITSVAASIIFTVAPPLTETALDLFSHDRLSKEEIVKKENDVSREIFHYLPVYRVDGFFANKDGISLSCKPLQCKFSLIAPKHKPEYAHFETKGLADSLATLLSSYLAQPGARPDTLAVNISLAGDYDYFLGRKCIDYYKPMEQGISRNLILRFGLPSGFKVNFRLSPNNVDPLGAIDYVFSGNNKPSLSVQIAKTKSMHFEIEVNGETKGNPSGIYLLFIPVWRIYRRWRKDYWGVFMDKLASKKNDFQKPDKIGFFEPFAPDDYDRAKFDSYMHSIVTERKQMRDKVTLRSNAEEAKKVLLLMDIQDYYWAKYMVSPTLEVGKQVLAQQKKRLNECFDTEKQKDLRSWYPRMRSEALGERWRHYNPFQVEDGVPGGYHWDENDGKLYLDNPSMREFFWPDYLAMKEYCKKTYGGEP